MEANSEYLWVILGFIIFGSIWWLIRKFNKNAAIENMNSGDNISGLETREIEFWNKFDQLVSLVGKARRTELLLRISIDANARAKAFQNTSYAKFTKVKLDATLKSEIDITKKQFGGQLKAFFSDSTLDELNSIREVAGALAHAQINQTRKKVEAHIKNYPSSKHINTNQFPGILFKNLTDDDGSKIGISYHPDPSSSNSTMLEWELFMHHGFDTICDEAFERATSIVKAKFSNIVLEEDMSRVMTAMKLGKKFPMKQS